MTSLRTGAAAAVGSAEQTTSPRVVALDVARAVAILGMLVVNVGPRDDSGPAAMVIRAAHGRASLLFVLLAGIGISLLTRRARQGGPSRWGTLVWRSALLLVAGLALQLLDHDVKVILPTYAVLFLVALAAVRLPDVGLLIGAGAATLLGPLVWIGGQQKTDFDMEPATLTSTPLDVLSSVVLTGPYPVVTWAAPFLLGMWLGRRRLTARAVQVRLVVVGAAAAVGGIVVSRVLVALVGQPGEEVGLDRLTSAVAHSQMPLWLVSGTGSALAVVGLALLLVPRAGRWAHPLVAVGQLSLTVYVAHLVVIAALVRPGPGSAAEGLGVSLLIAAAAVLFATLWRAGFRRGPLETLLRVPSLLRRAS
ncbi:DUF418 domain-containing protein [Georgenia sp. EYE_87]|uniref:DUF418 domain-containing protein n=1 Tax=Georgenia sp. EYE_87 TaxID=2853448 RepID=UPI0020065B27|nr:DUF418 domain-containing protein [Georgenia sp. EYE_87]MCK6210961.1 DUF418 domain-containing protein [Georgenia sp. EYE_87]